jgi:hypothetical protein
MPSFGWQLDDAQVAAVVTYIRNAGDAAAAPVSADDVSRARSALRGRTDKCPVSDVRIISQHPPLRTSETKGH